MFGDLLKTNYKSIMATEPVSEDARRKSYNGTVLSVDLSAPADHVLPENKIVTEKGCLDLTASIAYTLWVNGGDKGVTAEVLEKSAERVGHLAVLYSIYSYFNEAKVPVRLRGSDTVDLPFATSSVQEVEAPEGGGTEETKESEGKREDVLEPEVVVVDNPVWLAAKKLEAYLLNADNLAVQEKAAVDAKMILHAIVAVAIHRKLVEEHTWITKDTEVANTNTNRCLGVAGSAKDEFGKFMKAHGHDIVHHLTSDTLDAMCDILCQDVSPDMKGVIPVGSVYEYMGSKVAGKSICQFLTVTQSAKERWPVGTLGKSALIQGLGAIHSMLESIMQRVLVTKGETVLASVSELQNDLKSKDATRDLVVRCRANLLPKIAYAVGFMEGYSNSSYAESPSIAAVVKNHASSHNAGKSLATSVLSAPAHSKAITTAIASQFTDTISIVEVTTGKVTHTEVATEDVALGDDPTEVAHTRMLELMKLK